MALGLATPPSATATPTDPTSTASDTMIAQGRIASRRYAAPAWRSGDSAGMHDIIVRLFGEAEAFRNDYRNATLSKSKRS